MGIEILEEMRKMENAAQKGGMRIFFYTEYIIFNLLYRESGQLIISFNPTAKSICFSKPIHSTFIVSFFKVLSSSPP